MFSENGFSCPSASNGHVGIVEMRTRGLNQHGVTVVEFRRTFMLYRRSAPEATAGRCPEPATPWRV